MEPIKNYSLRIDHKVTSRFSKDQEFEKYLFLMNNALFSEEQLLYENREENLPTLHILGAPRSGTTLLSQIISSYLEVGYINNLIAAFWKAPLFGIQLSKKLLGRQYKSNFSSSFGRTHSIYEPHEFGYFWNYHLSYPDFLQRDNQHENSIDWQHLKNVFNNMTHGFEMPILFKSFLLGFHSHRFFKELQKTCFVYVRRNIIENAISILKVREVMLGNQSSWVSIKPKQYEWLQNEDIYTQIIGQILFLEYEYLKQLSYIPATNKLIISYEDVCQSPLDFLEKVQRIMENQGTKCSLADTKIDSFKSLEKVSTEDVKSKVRLFQNAYDNLLKEHSYLNSFS